MRNVFRFIGVLTLFIVCVWVLFTFVLITDEDRVYRIAQKCKTAFESGSVLSIAGELAAEYTDSSGADKALVIQSLYSLFDSTLTRSLQFTSVDIEIINDTAQVKIECLLRFQTRSGSAIVIPQIEELNGERLRVQLELVKIKNRWRVIHSDWKRIT